MKKYKPSVKTLKKVLSYFDDNLHFPLSIDDELYYRYKIQQEIFNREIIEIRESYWNQWSNEYLVRFSDGLYEKGMLIKRENR